MVGAAALFILSFLTFTYHYLLTRIFSVTMWYHFSAIVITLALAGLTFGAFSAYGKRSSPRVNCMFAALFSVGLLTGVLLHLNTRMPGLALSVPFVSTFLLQMLAITVPFFCSGFLICILLTSTKFFSKLYFYDLVGGALGCFAAPFLIQIFQGPKLVLPMTAISVLLTALFLGQTWKSRPGLVTLALQIFVFAAAATASYKGLLDVRYERSYNLNVDALQKERELIDFELWGPVSRITTLAERSETKTKITIFAKSDSGAGFRLVNHKDGLEPRKKSTPATLTEQPGLKKEEASVLVIGSAGGAEVQDAIMAGAAEVHAVEINPTINRIATNEFADFIGRVYDNPRVKLHTMDGRNFLRTSEKKFDHISVAMTDSWIGSVNSGYFFRENYLYTLEAIKLMLSRLNDGGVLNIVRYLRTGEGVRLANTIAATLQELNHEEISKKIFVYSEALSETYLRRLSIVVRPSGFPDEVAAKMASGLFKSGRYYPVFMPHELRDSEDTSREARMINRLITDRSEKRLTENPLPPDWPSDYRYVTDDSPFFFFIKGKYTHPASQGVLESISALGTLLFLLLILFSSSALLKKQVGLSAVFNPFFLGCGYMLLQIPILQKFSLHFGTSAYANSIGLGLILLFTGAGSFFARRLTSAFAIFFVGNFAALFLVDFVMSSYPSVGFTHTLKVLWFLLVFGQFFLAGSCLPSFILKFPNDPNRIQKIWLFNGLASSTATIFAFIFSLLVGFRSTMLMGLFCYLLFFTWTILHPRLRSAPR